MMISIWYVLDIFAVLMKMSTRQKFDLSFVCNYASLDLVTPFGCKRFSKLSSTKIRPNRGVQDWIVGLLSKIGKHLPLKSGKGI